MTEREVLSILPQISTLYPRGKMLWKSPVWSPSFRSSPMNKCGDTHSISGSDEASGVHACPHFTTEDTPGKQRRRAMSISLGPATRIPAPLRSARLMPIALPSESDGTDVADSFQEWMLMLCCHPGKGCTLRVTSGRPSCFTAPRSSTSGLEKAAGERGRKRGCLGGYKKKHPPLFLLSSFHSRLPKLGFPH